MHTHHMKNRISVGKPIWAATAIDAASRRDTNYFTAIVTTPPNFNPNISDHQQIRLWLFSRDNGPDTCNMGQHASAANSRNARLTVMHA